MASVPIFDAIVRFLIDNAMFVGLVGFGGYFLYQTVKLRRKAKMRPISRSEVERNNFIERMAENKSKWKLFRRGKWRIGKITHFREFVKYKSDDLTAKQKKLLTKEIGGLQKKLKNTEQNKEWFEVYEKLQPKMAQMRKLIEASEVRIVQFVVRSFLLPKLKLTNPLSKPRCFQVNKQHIDHDLKTEALIVPEWVTFDYIYGIYYDGTIEGEHVEIIKNDNILRTDLDLQASRYFVKSQEQCVFQPDVAQQMALREKELQIELAKRKGVKDTL